ncbi:DUF4347 domain-containing protein [Anabaena azotica]|uniref:DUF4347 domain-containing protein n=1 Tax=Anabaena azotica TaxID=197653 RepID=UPI0039A65ED8
MEAFNLDLNINNNSLPNLQVGSLDFDPLKIGFPQINNNQQLLFVDQGISNYQSLIAAIDPQMTVVEINSNQDGILQITNTLSKYNDIEAIHILSFANPGNIQVGNTQLNLNNFNQYTNQLATWNNYLTADADILLYGCNLAENAQGISLLQNIADVTGADIAASTDKTGNAALGGDWVLEENIGIIEASSLEITNYNSVFDTLISATQTQTIRQGLQSLADWLDTLDNFGSLAENIPIIDEKLGSLLDAGDLVRTQIVNPIKTYLDTHPSLTTNDLLTLIQGLANVAGVNLSTANNKLTYNLTYNPTVTKTVNLDLDQFGLDADDTSNFDIDAIFNFDFAFGVDLTAGLAPSEAFFIQVNDLTASADLGVDFATNSLNANLGFLGVGITGGTLDLNPQLDVTLNDPNSDGYLTINELQSTNLASLANITPTGTLNGELDFTVSSSFLPISGNPKLTIADNNIFDSTAPTVTTSDLEELLNFKTLTPSDLIGLLSQLGSGLEKLASGLNIPGGIPFIDTTIGEIVNLAQSIEAKIRGLYDAVLLGLSEYTGDIIAEIPKLSQAANFQIAINDNTPVNVVLAAGTYSDRTALVNAINVALNTAGLNGIVEATLDSDRIVFATINNADKLAIKFAANSIGMSELGFEPSLNTGSLLKFANIQELIPLLQDLLGSNPNFTYDANTNTLKFNLDFTNSIEEETEFDFNQEFDLGIGKLAISGGADGEIGGDVNFSLSLGIDLSPIGGSFTLDNSTLLTALPNPVTTVPGADIQIILADDNIAPIQVDLSTATTIGDIIQLIENATSQVEVTIDTERKALIIKDLSGGTDRPFAILAANNSTAGAKLGIIGVDLDEDGKIEGAALHGESILDRLFIAENSGIDANLNLTASDINLAAAISILQVGIANGTANLNIGTGISLKDPSADGKITLQEILDNPLSSLVNINTPTASGNINLPLVLSGLDDLGITLPANTAIELGFAASLSGITTSFNVPDVNLESIIQSFTDFSTDDLINVLGKVIELLNTQELGIFNQKIPLIDKSINELLEFTKPFVDTINSIVGSVADLRETLLNEVTATGTGIQDIIASPDFLSELAAHEHLQDELFHAIERIVDVINTLPEDINGLTFQVPALLLSAIDSLGTVIDEIESEITGASAAFNTKLAALKDNFTDILKAVPSVQKATDFILEKILDAVGLGTANIFTTVGSIRNNLETRIDALIAEIPTPSTSEQNVLNALQAAWNKLDTAVDLESLSSLVSAFSAIYDAIQDAETAFSAATFTDNINDLLDSLTSFSEALPVRLGLHFNSDLSLDFSLDIDLANFVDLTYTLPLNFSLEDTNLGVLPIGFETNGELEIEFGGSVVLDFGVDLTPASLAEAVYILPTTQLALTAYANLPDLDAAITIGGVGGVEIENGYIRFTDDTDNNKAASLTIGLNDANTDGKILLSELATTSTYNLTADGKFEVNLPIKVLGSSIGAITATLPDINDFSNFELSLPSANFFDDLFAGDLDLLTIIKGVEAFLTLLENALQSKALSSLPIIGDGLDFTGSTIGQLNDTFVKPLGDLIETLTLGDGAAAIKEAVQQKVFETIGPDGLNLIILNKDFHDEGNDGIADIEANWQDVEFIIDNDTDPNNAVNLLDTNLEILLNLNFGFQDTLSTNNFDLGFDGLGFIGLSLTGAVDITLDASFQVGFGLNKKQGAFIQLNNDANDPEINFGLGVSLSNDFELQGNLFFLNVIATNQDSDGDGKYTGIEGGFGVDLIDDDGTLDNRVGLLDIGSIDVDPKFNASVEIDLLLTANINDDANLPSIKADLLIDWALDDSKSLSDQSAPNFSLNNARLDLGEFISKAIGPILEEVNKYIEPIRPVLDILDKEIPVISDLSKLLGQGKVTFLDAIGALGEGGAEVAKVIRIFKEISDFVEDAAALNGKNIEITLGSLADIATDIRNATTINVDSNKISGVIKQGIDGVKNALSQVGSADATAAENFFTSSVGTADTGLGLAFPIFTDPSNIFKLLLGQTADLITWDIPAFKAGFSFSQLFGPIIPPIPIFARISGQLEVFADFFVGLDTRGLKTGNFLDGFYFGDKVGGVDVPELGLIAEFSAGAELNIVVASAGVRGGIRAGVFADWNDPNGDGKLYFDELIDNAQRGLECIFDLEGSLKAFLEAYVKIGFDTPFGFVTLFKKSFSLASVTLLDFSHSCPPLPPPVLGHVDGSGKLTLYTGSNAGKRQPGYSTDGDETLQVRQLEPGKIEVKGFGETQVYTGVTSIFWDGGKGNDVITIDASVTVNTTLTGGDGDDEIKGGSGVDNIDGGAGRDQITGGASSDIIHGGVGNDLIFGNAGADQLFGDDGDDNIYGGDNDKVNANDGDDTIDGGNGNDELVGNLGNDRITGGDGNDNIAGNEGNDTLEGGADTDLIEGGAGDDDIYGGAGNDILLGEGDKVKAGTGGNDKIWGGGGNDDIKALEGNNQIYGDGEDSQGVPTSTASEGDDSIITGNGADIIYGGGKNDTINAGGGNDYIEGGFGDDNIKAGSGDDKVIGGSSTALPTDADGNDVIYGEGGNDTITGDNAKFGSVILIGGAGSDRIFGDDGNDNLYGQGGDDLIEGGLGEDNLFGGTENDILRGQEGNDYIEGGANNDEISGGTGDDAIIGGVADLTTLNGKLDGIDTIIGDIGNDTILGDNGVITLTGNVVTAANTNANGGSGADNIFGGDGNDIIFGGGQADILVGDSATGIGNDIIIGDQGYLNATEIASQFSSVAGSSGNDTISGSGGNDIVLGGDGNDNITGDSGADILLGDYGTLSVNSGIVTRITSTVANKGGNDIITGGDNDDVVIGGTGDDTITGGDDNGADILLGDNGTVVRNDGSSLANDIFSTCANKGGIDNITGGAGNDIIVGGTAGDILQGNSGQDILLGDHGRIKRNAADVVERITTTLENNGGNDTISGNEDADIALGGFGNDIITGGDDVADDILLGDNGTVVRNDGSVDANDIISKCPNSGGVDTITGGAGNDIIIGGTAGDILQGNSGQDILLGDHGRIKRNAADVVERITTTLENNGGNDTISGNEDGDIALGGIGDDIITGGDDVADDILLGDNGTVVRNDGSVDANDIFSQSPDLGGVDTITGGAGNDIIIGGTFGDNLQGNAGNDVVIGDHAYITRNNADTIEQIKTIFPDKGGDDTITGDDGNDILIGGVGKDAIDGGAGNDIALGDNGCLDYKLDANLNTLDLVTTTNPTLGGEDIIATGDGNDLIFGGTLSDNISAGAGNDLVFGDHGKAEGNIDLNALPLNQVNPPFTFTAIDTQQADLGGDETISGGSGDDIILGQQGSDRLFGNEGDDDLIGGHNVAGGFDGNDEIDGGTGNDVIAGDNASVLRRADTRSPRIRVLSGTVIYDSNGNPQVTANGQLNPTGAAERNIQLFDHSINAAVGTFGNDLIAGGANDDLIFGQLGNDVIQGDSSTAETVSPTNYSVTAASDGDDYIEGGGGDDLIFGNLGQDDIIGGSSSLFGNTTASQRPDGKDVIFGGAGTSINRNDVGDTSANGHARDADVIIGDNANIFRLVGTNGVSQGKFLTFTYDNYGNLKIIPRAVEQLDYTLGGNSSDLGNDDLIRGEAGDDVIYGMTGNDVIFGDGQDDDIYGGAGSDRIYGGTGEDGILGDDGKIYTSRNGLTETLNGITQINAQTNISIPGPFTGAWIYITGRLHKTVDLAAWEQGGNDVIYGGLGDDFLHGGAGDDGISGAEAQANFYNSNSVTNTNPLNYDPVTRKLAAYDANNPMTRINNFFLNFDAVENGNNKINDGKDRIFGDLGNDWLVGGTQNDRLFGGKGDDVINGDDNHDTNGGLNNRTDSTQFADRDFAFGGGGLDVLIANTGGDRLFDWIGEFNSYLVPFSPFGEPTVYRSPSPHIKQFLLDLGKESGADQTRTEPNGELGLVSQGDPEWQDQSGSPRDPQAGNTQARRDTQGNPEDDRNTALPL